MSAFSDAELAYLREPRMGRLATSDAAGQPHVVPIGMWRYNAELDTIDVTGRDFAKTRKFRIVQANPKAAFVIDDMASIDPWRPRSVLIMGPRRGADRRAFLQRIGAHPHHPSKGDQLGLRR
ncbi:MAG: PPOX class F420-dependent oxidoreductase [Egibacteraceae bacterium]